MRELEAWDVLVESLHYSTSRLEVSIVTPAIAQCRVLWMPLSDVFGHYQFRMTIVLAIREKVNQPLR
jgi:hypothetical protein